MENIGYKNDKFRQAHCDIDRAMSAIYNWVTDNPKSEEARIYYMLQEAQNFLYEVDKQRKECGK